MGPSFLFFTLVNTALTGSCFPGPLPMSSCMVALRTLPSTWFGSQLSARRWRTASARIAFLAFFAATGLASVVLFWAVHPYGEAPLVGASGAISGMMGAAARFGFRIDRSSGKAAFAGAPLPIAAVLRSRGVMTFLAVWMVINLVTGLVELRSRNCRPDRLGSPYWRLCRRLLRPALFRSSAADGLNSSAMAGALEMQAITAHDDPRRPRVLWTRKGRRSI